MRILVVDDESLVRESLITSLKNMDFNDIIEAENGIEAFELIHRTNPNIVIADIRMPGMNGIELLSKVNQTMKDIIFIFLSGYDLFEYAQAGINLGAFSYLLKPIKSEQLGEVMNKACMTLEQKNLQKEAASLMKIKMNQGLEFMKRHFILELLTQKHFSEKYLTNKFQELQIRFDFSHFCVIIISLDDYINLVKNKSLRDRELLKFSVQNIAVEVFDSHMLSSYSFEVEDEQGFLLNFSQQNSSQGYSTLYNSCEKINEYVSQLMNFTVTIGIGNITNSFAGLYDSFEASQKAIAQRLIKGPNQVIHLENPQNHVEAPKVIDFKTEQAILAGFEKCDRELVMQLINELYSPFISIGFVETSGLMKLNFQVILLIYKILSRLGITPEETLGEEFVLYDEINTCNSIDAIINWYSEKLNPCFEILNSLMEKSNKKLVEKAKDFIHANISRDIDLEAVAAHIHLSHTYLSKIFKQETGENFIDYVINYKISKAKKLLEDGTYKINEIPGLVGFKDIKYFYKVFKRITGLSPSNYKDIANRGSGF